jgi:hypothetical protein
MIALSELASKKLHFIGIGGAGMSGLARIALTHGAHVSGSDEKDSSVLAALSALGATVFSSHKSSQVTDADLVIYSNAISKSNPEIVHANELGIPVYTRAQALALLMSQSISIAVAGTHGKTRHHPCSPLPFRHAELIHPLQLAGLSAHQVQMHTEEQAIISWQRLMNLTDHSLSTDPSAPSSPTLNTITWIILRLQLM